MQGTLLWVVSLILLFTTQTGGSAFRHHVRARTRKQLKNSLKKTDLKSPLGKIPVYELTGCLFL